MPQGWGGIGQVGMAVAPLQHYSQSSSQVHTDTESRVPVINLKDGTRLAGDDAPRRKDLEQWLKEHPGFVADTGAFIPVSPCFVFRSVIPMILHFKCIYMTWLPNIYLVRKLFTQKSYCSRAFSHETVSILCPGGK